VLIFTTRTPWNYILLVLLGIIGGSVFNKLVLHQGKLEHGHQTKALLAVPLMTLVDVAVLYFIVDKIKEIIKLEYNTDPLIFYFGLCLIIPYFIWFTLGKHTKQE